MSKSSQRLMFWDFPTRCHLTCLLDGHDFVRNLDTRQPPVRKVETREQRGKYFELYDSIGTRQFHTKCIPRQEFCKLPTPAPPPETVALK